jgi:hypothetical protein
VEDVEIRKPDLEDVFIDVMTAGHHPREEATA